MVFDPSMLCDDFLDRLVPLALKWMPLSANARCACMSLTKRITSCGFDQWRDFNSFGDMVSDEGLSPPVLRNAEQSREGVKRRLKTGRHSKRWEIEPLNVEGKI
jgi:hypothetical protein